MNLQDLMYKYTELSEITNSDLVLIITGLIVLFYTIFTFQLWKESVRQTFLQNIPIPVLYLRERRGKDIIRIRNHGHKPLVNVMIEDWKIDILISKKYEKYCFKFTLPSPNVLAFDEEIDVIINQYLNGKLTAHPDLSPLINPKYSPFSTPIHVVFNDIQGKKYYLKFLFGKGGFKISSSIKKYTIIKRLSIITIDLTHSLIISPLYKHKIIKLKKI